MILEEDAQKQCQVLNKVLFIFFAILVRLTDVSTQGKHLEHTHSDSMVSSSERGGDCISDLCA